MKQKNIKLPFLGKILFQRYLHATYVAREASRKDLDWGRDLNLSPFHAFSSMGHKFSLTLLIGLHCARLRRRVCGGARALRCPGHSHTSFQFHACGYILSDTPYFFPICIRKASRVYF